MKPPTNFRPKEKGMGGHQKSEGRSQDWITPLWLLHAIGEFDLDPCACDVMPWKTAKIMWTKDDDGLSREWVGRVWLNPPYGTKTQKWMKRLAEHGRGMALIFARTETAMFHRHVWEVADAILFIEGRITFCHPNGMKGKYTGGAPSVLVAYGESDVEILQRSGIRGKFVRLKGAIA